MVKTVTTAIRVRKRGTSSANFAGRPPKNLPDAHTDELVLKVPPMPEELEKLPKAQKLWGDFCRTLIHRGKLNFTAWPMQATTYYVNWDIFIMLAMAELYRRCTKCKKHFTIISAKPIQL